MVIGVEPCRQFASSTGMTVGEVVAMGGAFLKDNEGSFASIKNNVEVRKIDVLDLKEGKRWIYKNLDERDRSKLLIRVYKSTGKARWHIYRLRLVKIILHFARRQRANLCLNY